MVGDGVCMSAHRELRSVIVSLRDPGYCPDTRLVTYDTGPGQAHSTTTTPAPATSTPRQSGCHPEIITVSSDYHDYQCIVMLTAGCQARTEQSDPVQAVSL